MQNTTAMAIVEFTCQNQLDKLIFIFLHCDSMTTTQSIQSLIDQVLEIYLKTDHGYEPTNLYQLIVNEIEKPLLKSTLQHTNGNLSKAASILGWSRSTLRKKLQALSIEKKQ